MGTPADLKALYRLVHCQSVTLAQVIKPHCQLTLKRMQESDQVVLLIHDTTQLNYTGKECRKKAPCLPSPGVPREGRSSIAKSKCGRQGLWRTWKTIRLSDPSLRSRMTSRLSALGGISGEQLRIRMSPCDRGRTTGRCCA